MKFQKGFTLVELMVVVAIIGLLAGIALPAYNKYVQRSKIAEAASNLSAARVIMEQWYQDNRTYKTSRGAAGTACGATMPTNIKHFTLGCVANTDDTYTITATGVTEQGMAGFAYTVDQSNTRASNMTAPATTAGWSNPNPNTCWTVKPGGVC